VRPNVVCPVTELALYFVIDTGAVTTGLHARIVVPAGFQAGIDP
jgi:hypothetical protein